MKVIHMQGKVLYTVLFLRGKVLHHIPAVGIGFGFLRKHVSLANHLFFMQTILIFD